MKRLKVELISPRPPSRFAWALLVVLTVAAAGALTLAQRWQNEADALREQILREREEQLLRASRPAAPLPPPPYAQSAREYLAESGPWWTSTLLALERAARVGVTPASVDLQAHERSARVEVEFSDYAVLLAYLSDLNAGLERSEWVLESAQAGDVGRPGRSVLRRRW